jgi:heat shock protein HtpX
MGSTKATGKPIGGVSGEAQGSAMPSNFLKTGLLLVAMTAIFMAMGALVGGQTGLALAFVFALVMNLVTYWKSDALVLRMHKAVEVDAQAAPELHRIVADLSARADLPMPKVYVMNSPQPNAFATGRNPANSAVCASTGLLDMLTPQEVAGVMAHELAHIKNRDTLTMTVAASIGGAISMSANMLQLGMLFGGSRNARGGTFGTLIAAIVAPVAATLVHMAISRSREYQADLIGARICGNPLWLASALVKIQNAVRGGARNATVQMVPASAHMFIINPLTGRGLDNFFSTHPKTENRVAELEKLAQEWAQQTPAQPDGRFLPQTSPATGRTVRPMSDTGRRSPWS